MDFNSLRKIKSWLVEWNLWPILWPFGVNSEGGWIGPVVLAGSALAQHFLNKKSGDDAQKANQEALKPWMTGATNLRNTASDRSAEQYNQVSGLPSEILNQYRGMLGGIGEGGGRGPLGPIYKEQAFESSALPFYKEMMETGGYTDADKANILSYATGPISGMFGALSRQLGQARASRGLPSYSSGDSRLMRDAAYESSNLAKGVSGDLAERVLANRFQGGSGTAGIEQQQRQFEAAERARAHSSRAARAAAGRSSANQEFGQRMAILDAMGSYRPGSDIQYMGAALGANQQGMSGAASGQRYAGGGSDWGRLFGNMGPAAIAAFGNGGGGNRQEPMTMPESGSYALTRPLTRSW
jgi:hypothetical protein